LAIRQYVDTGMNMRKLILGTASVLALAIGSAALDYVADVGSAADAGTIRPAFETSQSSRTAAFLRKDNIRWAQLELRNMGLYRGSLDGIEGPETKRALDQFQSNSGLKRTAMLDPQTLDALVGNPGISNGSSVSPDAEHPKSMMHPSGSSSNLGN
jgi:peptidoglycan hydrolase-like protein with peptidoglycan-binding domain